MKHLASCKLFGYALGLLLTVPLSYVYSFDISPYPSLGSLKHTTEISFVDRPSNEGIILHIANRTTTLNRIFFKAYILKDNTAKSKASKDFHLKIIDPKGSVIISQLHKIENGKVEGAVVIPKETIPGKYVMRVYTLKMYQRPFDNYVEENIYLLNDRTKYVEALGDTPRVSVEGGVLVSEKVNKIIVYRPVISPSSDRIKGVILDNQDNLVSKVQMYSEEIGSANFKPKADRLYYLQFGNKKKIPLPKPVTDGYLLNVNNLDPEMTIARIYRSSSSLRSPVWLSGRIGGKEFFRQALSWVGDMATVNVNKRLLPSGILMLSVEDSKNQTLALRPVIAQNQDVNMFYESNNESKDQELLKIKTKDSMGPISSEFAVSINKYGSLENLFEEATPTAVHRSSLEKNSELVSHNTTRSNNFIKDLYLQIKKGKNGANGNPNIMPSELPQTREGIGFSAYVYDLNNNLLSNTAIQMFIKSEDGISILETRSDAEGLIKCENLDFPGTASFTFRTQGVDTKSRLVKAVLIEDETAFSLSKGPKFSNVKKQVAPITKSNVIQKDTVGIIRLDNATVTDAKRINKIKGVTSIYGIEVPGIRVKYQDHERPKTLAQLLVEIPGVNVINGNGIDQRLRILRANGHVQWVIDGYALPIGVNGLVYDYPFNSLLPVQDFISDTDIDRIDLLLGPDASIFGTRASGGAIVITTRFGSELEYVNRKDAALSIRGYEPKVDFESYQESLSKKEKRAATLLYWNPSLVTDKNGEGTINISTALENQRDIRIDFSTAKK